MPYEGDDGVEETSFHLDHIPVTIENECYRLKHLGDSRDMSHGKGWKADKNWQYIAKQKFLDHQKGKAIAQENSLFIVALCVVRRSKLLLPKIFGIVITAAISLLKTRFCNQRTTNHTK